MRGVSQYKADLTDRWLRDNLSKKKYDDLNQAIFKTVPEMYRNETVDSCPTLIENAQILNHIYESDPEDAKEFANCPEFEEKDLSKMTTTEIYLENIALMQAIRNQREANEKLLQEIQLLDPAMRQLDLEKQGYFVELMNIEREMNTEKDSNLIASPK
ncbi:hypothetical protein TVAG_029220 [Trichomonas vaginalis G3]|uniref:Uncharacterized protein n=1 Tax=Trichomonas vaginalis (strain ATCC PRA-98 / G3) TaxID=412133 RepID=A2F514_TRIV3|nr:hypothetical protein TVAGG3_0594700 [Trichomonas vaginalis G3]EAY00018.1 hypothetical protein TVAG_029220 [Trichomonas vaginalis G3]KAI5523519.1 hypothetical protein TVAGG3_0594700 [Trichomonas vaginalis G3]|eukprot:XP_001312947.1 hypothetical protein [Trichomonas vaginalis G3]